jgi:hypothetical protein
MERSKFCQKLLESSNSAAGIPGISGRFQGFLDLGIGVSKQPLPKINPHFPPQLWDALQDVPRPSRIPRTLYPLTIGHGIIPSMGLPFLFPHITISTVMTKPFQLALAPLPAHRHTTVRKGLDLMLKSLAPAKRQQVTR